MIARWRAFRARSRRTRAIRRALEHHADQLGDPMYGAALALARRRETQR